VRGPKERKKRKGEENTPRRAGGWEKSAKGEAREELYEEEGGDKHNLL
jgi:hypothetical protein